METAGSRIKGVEVGLTVPASTLISPSPTCKFLISHAQLCIVTLMSLAMQTDAKGSGTASTNSRMKDFRPTCWCALSVSLVGYG